MPLGTGVKGNVTIYLCITFINIKHARKAVTVIFSKQMTVYNAISIT